MSHLHDKNQKYYCYIIIKLFVNTELPVLPKDVLHYHVHSDFTQVTAHPPSKHN